MSRKLVKKVLLILYLSQSTHITKQNLYYDILNWKMRRKVTSLKLLRKVEAALMIGDDDDGNSKVSCKVQKHFHGILDYWSNLNHFGYDYHSGGDHSVMENKNIFT